MSDNATPREKEQSMVPALSPRGKTPPSSARRSARPFSSRGQTTGFAQPLPSGGGGGGGGHYSSSTLARTPRTPRVSSEPLHVAIKIRPPGNGEDVIEHKIVDGSKLMLVSPAGGSDMGGGAAEEETRQYDFGNIFGSDSSDDCLPNLVVPKVLEQMRLGYNSTLLCYGQTGSGKTHSISSFLPKCVEAVFQSIETETEESPGDISYIVELSFLQIYNGNVFNLLGSGSSGSGHHNNSSQSQRRNSGNDTGEALPKPRGFLVPEPCLVVKTAEEALNLWGEAQKKRVTCGHAMNHRSSRSHCILSLHVAKLLDGTPIQGSKITLVDLAGSERLKKTEVEAKDQKQEAISINSSLTALQRTIKEISEGNPNPPYRDNVLTMYLAQSLSDACNIIVACISIESSNLSETKSTLEFATVAKKCVVTRSKNFQRIAGKRGNFEATWEQLKTEILCLRNKVEVLQSEADLERQRNRMLQQQNTLQIQPDGTVVGFNVLGGGAYPPSSPQHYSVSGSNTPSNTPHLMASGAGGGGGVSFASSSLETDKVTRRIGDLEKQSSSFAVMLREKEDELRQLDSKRGDAADLAMELQDRENTMAEARELLAAEAAELHEHEAATAVTSSTPREQALTKLQSKFEKLNESFMWQDERYYEAVEKNRVLQLNLENLQRTIGRQNGDLHTAHVNALKWEEQLTAMKNKVAQVQEAKSKVQAEFDDLELKLEREKIEGMMKRQASNFDAKGEATRRGELRELQETIEEQKAVYASLSERAKVAEEHVLTMQKETAKAEGRANAAEQAYRNFDRRSSFSDRRNNQPRGFTGAEPLPQGTNPYEVASLRKQLGTVNADKAGLQEVLKAREHQNTELAQKLEETESELILMKQQYKCLQQLEESHSLEGEAYAKREEELYNEIEANISERENLERELEKKIKTVIAADAEYRTSVQEIEKLHADLDNLHQKLRKYEEREEELSARLREATDETNLERREREAEVAKVSDLLKQLKQSELQSEELHARLESDQRHTTGLQNSIATRRRAEKHLLSRMGDLSRERGGSRALADGRHQKTLARVHSTNHHVREGSNFSATHEPAYVRLSTTTSSKEGSKEPPTHMDPQLNLVSTRFAQGTRSNKLKENFSNLAHKNEKREGELAAAAATREPPAVIFRQYAPMSPNSNGLEINALPVSNAAHRSTSNTDGVVHHQRSTSNTSLSVQTPRGLNTPRGGDKPTPRDKGGDGAGGNRDLPPSGPSATSASHANNRSGQVKFKPGQFSAKSAPGRHAGIPHTNRASDIQMRAKQQQQSNSTSKPAVLRTPAVPTLALAKAQSAAN